MIPTHIVKPEFTNRITIKHDGGTDNDLFVIETLTGRFRSFGIVDQLCNEDAATSEWNSHFSKAPIMYNADGEAV